ncbi:hypothetical protein HZS_3755 [Henneguya salminicola]|nr:hypothetical protein HZS_3755 [Henneguya salminicola]
MQFDFSLFSVGAILMLILHFCADYVEGSHPQIQDSNNEKVSITNSLSTEEHLATTNLTTSTKKDESQS